MPGRLLSGWDAQHLWAFSHLPAGAVVWLKWINICKTSKDFMVLRKCWACFYEFLSYHFLPPKCRLRVIWGLFQSCGGRGLMARSWTTATYWILFLGAGDSVMNPGPYCHWTHSRASFMFQMSCVKRSLWFDETVLMEVVNKLTGIPKWLSGKEPACQCRRHRRCGFHPWVGKIPWRRAWQPAPVFLPGESHGEESGGPQSIGPQRGTTEAT